MRVKSIVCVKRVPDTEARIRIAGDGSSIDPSGVKFVLNPYDEFALEAALKHKEAAGQGEVTVISAGDASSAETLRTALAMGADGAGLLKTDRPARGGRGGRAAQARPPRRGPRRREGAGGGDQGPRVRPGALRDEGGRRR